MKVSQFRSELDSHPVLRETDWHTLARELTTHDFTRPSKKGLPCFSPAEFVPDAPTKQAKYVVRVWFGVIDLDDVTTDEIGTVMSATAGMSSAWYTTWSHPEAVKSGQARLRLVVPFTRPVEAREWSAFWPRMVARLGGICDAKCSNPDRVYFGPYMPPGTEGLAWSMVR